MGTDIPDYQKFADNFQLEDLATAFSGDLRTGINGAVECCDRYCEPGRKSNGSKKTLTQSRSLPAGKK